jgi:hypothetical protein
MSTYQRDDETVVMPPASEAAMPSPRDELARMDPAVVRQAAYAIDYQSEEGLAPDVERAVRLLRATGYPHNSQPAQAAAAARPREDRSGWPKALADPLSTASFIAALVGFTGLGSVAAIICGGIAIANAHKAKQRAHWTACWGLGLGIAEVAAWILLIIVLVAAMASIGSANAGYTG